MPLRSVYCIATTRGRVDSIVVNLRDEGFTCAEISVLFLDPDKSMHGPDAEALAHASAGAIRGVIASIDGIRRLLLPGLGPVIAGGVIGRAAASGADPGTLGSMLLGFGVPGTEATRYASRIMAGHVFIAVQTPHSGAGDKAREIFVAGKADDICTKLDVVPERLTTSAAAARRVFTT